MSEIQAMEVIKDLECQAKGSHPRQSHGQIQDVERLL